VSAWTLAIETSASPGSVALASADRPPASLALEGRFSDSARSLLPAIDELFRRAGARPAELARVVLGVGPGSYTGLRIGAAAAAMLAAQARAQLAAHASTLAMAAAAPPRARTIAVVLDALRGDVALALYERGERFPREVAPPRLLSAAEAAREISGVQAVVSSQPERVMRLLGSSAFVFPCSADAAILLELDRAGAPPRPDALPIYLRASAAEEKRRAGGA
jgi:tRNA threonylcarbamoyladenosine biosynthesis protein TsaB